MLDSTPAAHLRLQTYQRIYEEILNKMGASSAHFCIAYYLLIIGLAVNHGNKIGFILR